MTWLPDPRHVKTFGDITLTPERQGQETAHRVDIPGGLSVRVLPDGQTSGQKRSHVIVKALTALGMLDPQPKYGMAARYLLGQLALAGFEWEWVDLAEEAKAAVKVEEWLETWFYERDLSPAYAYSLLEDLKVDGWVVSR